MLVNKSWSHYLLTPFMQIVHYYPPPRERDCANSLPVTFEAGHLTYNQAKQ